MGALAWARQRAEQALLTVTSFADPSLHAEQRTNIEKALAEARARGYQRGLEVALIDVRRRQVQAGSGPAADALRAVLDDLAERYATGEP